MEEVGRLAICVVDGADTFDRKIVTDADMEIGFISRCRGQRARIKIGVARLRTFGVGVSLNREDEGRAWSALGSETSLCALGEIARALFTIVQSVKIFGVRRETIDGNFGGLT